MSEQQGSRSSNSNNARGGSMNNNCSSSRSGGNSSSGRSALSSISTTNSTTANGRKYNNNNNNNGNPTPGRGREKKMERRGGGGGGASDHKGGVVMDEQETRLNSNVCKRMDPNFSKIIRVASQVGLYEYDCQAGKWTSAGISGCLFLYERSQSPKNGIIILNRNSLDNFLQLLTPDIEIQVDMPHILMNNHEVIRCLWFYSKADCMDIAYELSKRLGIQIKNQKIQPTSTPAPESTPTQAKPETAQGNQILSLLFNLQQNSTTENVPSKPVISRGSPSRTQGSQESGLGNLFGKSPAFVQLHELEDKLRHESGTAGPSQTPPSKAPEDPFLQLFQQKTDGRSEVLQENPDEDADDPLARCFLDHLSDKNARGTNSTGAKTTKIDILGDELRATLGIKKKSDTPVTRWVGSQETDNALRNLHLDVENGLVLDDFKWEDPEAVTPAREPAALNIDAMRMFVNDCRQFSDDELNGESRAQFERRKAEIFEKERREAAIRQVNTRESELLFQKSGSRANSLHSDGGGGDFPRNSAAILLNKDQMIQALTYLLKTDPDFTDKLHQAYLNSVLESREH